MTGEAIRFEVRGNPVPEGSYRAFLVKGRAIVTHARGRHLNDWRHLVRSEAQRYAPAAPWGGPVGLVLHFHMQQPKSRPAAVGRGKSRHPILLRPDRRPDLDKLARGVLDALVGVYFLDDAQVVHLYATKDYGTPGLSVAAFPLGDGPVRARPPPEALPHA